MQPATDTQEKKAGLAHWAQRVLEECDKASVDFAPDPVHDLRVAIRRCRSMADGFLSIDPDPAWKQMKKLGKPVFASLGDLRDTQVMEEWVSKLSQEDDPARKILLDSLQQKETELKAAAQQALHNFDRKRWVSLNQYLAKRAGRIPLEGSVFQLLAVERWQDAYALHRQALRNRSSVAYHQLRIGIKRLRYTVENFLPQRNEQWSKDLRDLQDALGEVHDFDVLWAMIKAHPEISFDVRNRWRQRLLQERQKRLDLYRKKMLGRNSLWHKWREGLPSGEQLEKAALEKLRTWAAFLDPDCEHSRYVTKLALLLFDEYAQHGISAAKLADRRILEAAGMLHEIGHSKNGIEHHKRAFRMISKLTPPIGWSAEDIHAAAVVARYHRGALPRIMSKPFAGINVKRRRELLPLAGFLRLANAFDVDHQQNVSVTGVEKQEELVVISAKGFQTISPIAEKLARARYLLEAACKLPIRIKPVVSSSRTRRARRVPSRVKSSSPRRASVKKHGA
jgi:exopolyphosphatase/guanosine-5'-triphosphate,3'-diphosphate pyrophosphatase